MDLQKRFLVVEDSPTQAMRLQHLLKSAGAEVVVAGGGQAALDLLAQDAKWDAILSDIDMPEIDGFELCKRIKQLPVAKAVPFILLVSLKDMHDILKALKCQADNILMKEYDKTYFLPELELALTNASAAHKPPAEPAKFFFEGQWHEVCLPQGQLATILVSAFAMAIHQKAARQPAVSKA